MTPKRVRTVEGSCWACKDRRVICDLQRPQCSRCVSEDQVCEYGKVRLRWCNGIAARGRFAGQNVPVSSNYDNDYDGLNRPMNNAIIQQGKYRKVADGRTASPCSLSPEESVKEEMIKAEDEEEETPSVSSTSSSSSSSSSASPPSLSSSPSTESISSLTSVYPPAFHILEIPTRVTGDQLMLYFEHIVVDRFNLSTEPVSVDLASVYKHPALRYSVTAVANAHQQISQSPEQCNSSLSKSKARLKAIQNFRTQLLTPNHTHQHRQVSYRFLPLDLFIANVLLCILDGVIDPHDENAATHVHYRGGRAILGQWKKLQQQLQQKKRGLPVLMLSCFVTMDLTYSLLSGDEQHFHHSTWADFAECDSWWGVLPPGDPFLNIMQILSRLAELGHCARRNGGGNSRHETARCMFSDEIDAMTVVLRGYTLPTDVQDGCSPSFVTTSKDLDLGLDLDTDTVGLLSNDLLYPMSSTEPQFEYEQSWTIFCNAYRLAGLIYIYRAFHHLDATNSLVQQATSCGLKAICETRLKGKLAHCLLFPALVIGAHCRTAGQQKAILGAMRSTASFLQFGSLRVMEDFLHRVWARSLSDDAAESWWDCFEPISKKTFLF